MLFKKTNRVTSTSNVSSTQISRLVVLGACCQKSAQSFENVKLAAKQLGITDTVINIGDFEEIARYGVMQTPALVIDGKVVSYGKLIKVDDAVKLLSTHYM